MHDSRHVGKKLQAAADAKAAAAAAAAWAAEAEEEEEEEEEEGDGCSLSLSLQWRYPFPVGFIRDFAPRLLRAKETHFCFEHWAPFITGDVDGVRRLAFPVLRAAASSNPHDQRDAERSMRRRIRQQFQRMDADSDGFVTRREKAADFKEIRRAEAEAGALVEFEPGREAADWISFHDEPLDAATQKEQQQGDGDDDDDDALFVGGDGDGRVSLDEWEAGIRRLVQEYVIARQQGAVDVEDEDD